MVLSLFTFGRRWTTTQNLLLQTRYPVAAQVRLFLFVHYVFALVLNDIVSSMPLLLGSWGWVCTFTHR